MSEEEKSYIPSLTLEPNAQAVAAVAEEEKKEEEKIEDIPIERLELSKLSPAEQAAVTGTPSPHPGSFRSSCAACP